MDNKRREILERIANHVKNQDRDNLTHSDGPSHNSHAESGFFPEFKAPATKPQEAKEDAE